jgi:hypothetical protein
MLATAAGSFVACSDDPAPGPAADGADASDAAKDGTPVDGRADVTPGDAGADQAVATDAAAEAGVLAGETCDTAVAIAVDADAGTKVKAQSLLGYGDDLKGNENPVCVTGHSEDRFYYVDVPAGKELNVRLTSVAPYDGLINLIPGDDASVCKQNPLPCAVGDDLGSAGEPESAAWYNGTGTTKRTFVMIDQENPVTGGTFDLDLTLADPKPGETCENAETVSPTVGGASVVLSNQSNGGYGNNYGNYGSGKDLPVGCNSSAGVDRVYQLDIPAGATLAVQVVPESVFNATVNIVRGTTAAACNARPRTCVANSDDGANGTTEDVTYTNMSNGVEHVYVMVDSVSARQTPRTYSISFGLTNVN